jgi:hypothetical protein
MWMARTLEILFGILSNVGSFDKTRHLVLQEPFVPLALQKVLFTMHDIALLNEVFRLQSAVIPAVFTPQPKDAVGVDHWLAFFSSLDVLAQAVLLLENTLDATLLFGIVHMIETLRYYSPNIQAAIWDQTDYVAVLCSLMSGEQEECISSSGKMGELMGTIESVAGSNESSIVVIKLSFNDIMSVVVNLVEDFDESVEPALNVVALCIHDDVQLKNTMLSSNEFRMAIEALVRRNDPSSSIYGVVHFLRTILQSTSVHVLQEDVST